MEQKFEGWFIVEQLGHKRLAGYVMEHTIAGCGFLRVDMFGEEGEAKATQFILPSTLYCITPVSEAIARKIGEDMEVKPPSVLQLEYTEQQKRHDNDAGEEW